jgi:hypothetical protein
VVGQGGAGGLQLGGGLVELLLRGGVDSLESGELRLGVRHVGLRGVGGSGRPGLRALGRGQLRLRGAELGLRVVQPAARVGGLVGQRRQLGGELTLGGAAELELLLGLLQLLVENRLGVLRGLELRLERRQRASRSARRSSRGGTSAGSAFTLPRRFSWLTTEIAVQVGSVEAPGVVGVVVLPASTGRNATMMGTMKAARPTGRLDFFTTFLVERATLWNADMGQLNLSGAFGGPGGDCQATRR